MSKPQRRFKKEYEITAEILKYKRKGLLKIKSAELIEAKMQGMVEAMNSPCATAGEIAFQKEQHGHARKKAYKLRRSAELIEDEKIPRLVRTLGALQTMTLPGINDEGVVLQK